MLRVEYNGAVVTCDTVDEAVAFLDEVKKRGGTTSVGFKADKFIICTNADGWIPWSGGSRPVGRDIEVEVKYRDGDTEDGTADSFFWWHDDVDSCHGSCTDIVAYRIVGSADA